jgi:hypothetical protein
MKYSVLIDQKISLEWGLNQNQAALFSVLINSLTWADEMIIEGKVFYFASRQMIINEIPLFYSKKDTVYRALIKLKELELIEYTKFGNKDLFRITNKGKCWNNADSSDNSEINPNKLGNESEYNSDLNPTDHNTKEDHNTKDQLNWKNDFKIYLSELRIEYEKLIKDSEFIKQQEKYNPGIDIQLSLEKACVNFWATDGGWVHKKRKKIEEINWKSTLINAIPLNKVYKKKQETGKQAKHDLNKEEYNWGH